MSDTTQDSSALVQGTLDMLILRTLALEPMHGYGIAQRIQQVSKGVFVVRPGSLFAAFRRLERGGYVRTEWKTTEFNRRGKYFALTASGKRRLKDSQREWRRQIDAVTAILQRA